MGGGCCAAVCKVVTLRITIAAYDSGKQRHVARKDFLWDYLLHFVAGVEVVEVVGVGPPP